MRSRLVTSACWFASLAVMMVVLGFVPAGAQEPGSAALSPGTIDSLREVSRERMEARDSSANPMDPYQRSEVKFFTLDHALLRYDDQRVQIELFTLIDRSQLAVEKADDGVQAVYEVTFRVFSENDSLLIENSWERRDWSPDTTSRQAGQKIPELIKYVLLPATYDIEAVVVDKVAQTWYSTRYSVDVDAYDEGELAVSSIILASRVEKAKGNVGEFNHNGLLVLPNAERMFGLSNPRVFYYTEIYNLTEGPEATYTVYREVINDNHKVAKELDPRTRKVPATHCVDVDAFSIGTLPSGSYTLRITAKDNATDRTAVGERKFWVYRPGERRRTRTLEYPGFDIAAMSDEEVSRELEVIRYILSKRAQDQVEELTSGDARRRFLARFWISTDPDTTTVPNEFRQEYMRRLRYVNERFNTVRREGWQTDRGRVYLMHGEPNQIEDQPFEEASNKSYQIWHYDNIEGGVIYVFVDRAGYGDYIQVHSTKKGELENPNWRQQELGVR